MNNYKLIEDILEQVMSLLAGIFSQSEVKEVQEFIDVGEYGLAISTIMDIIDEESKSTPDEVIDLLKQATIAMELDAQHWISSHKH